MIDVTPLTAGGPGSGIKGTLLHRDVPDGRRNNGRKPGQPCPARTRMRVYRGRIVRRDPKPQHSPEV